MGASQHTGSVRYVFLKGVGAQLKGILRGMAILLGGPLLLALAVLISAAHTTLPGTCLALHVGLTPLQGLEPHPSLDSWKPWSLETARPYLAGPLPSLLDAPGLSLSLSLETARYTLLEILGTPNGRTWGCQTVAGLAELISQSLLLVGFALVLSVLIGCARAWYRTFTRPQPTPSPSALTPLLVAPTILWAAAATVGINLLILRLSASFPALDPALYKVPGGAFLIRWAAALAVLVAGGGTTFQLTRAITLEMRRLAAHEQIVSARANGLPVTPRLLRGLVAPVFGLATSALPVVLGESIVVEYVFGLEGIGYAIRTLSEKRDAPALMLITFFFLGLTLGLHGVQRRLSAWLNPVKQEIQR